MSATAHAPVRPASSRAPALFGRVMALVALTVGFATLGAWIGRDWGGTGWFIAWLAAVASLIGLKVANARGNMVVALGLLLAFGLVFGASVATTINYYAATDPTAIGQAFGATALFMGALGAGGYAVRRDLGYLYRVVFWLLVAFVTGIVVIVLHIPAAYTLWSLVGLGVFGLYAVADFNRLRHGGIDEAIPLAAGIFLDSLMSGH